MNCGDWGLGIGDWGLGSGEWGWGIGEDGGWTSANAQCRSREDRLSITNHYI